MRRIAGIIVVLASFSQVTAQNKATIRELRLDVEAKVYVLNGRVGDDVRLCVAIPADKRLACVSAGELRERYEKR